MDETQELARVEASPARRAFGLGVVFCLGALMIWLALFQRQSAPLLQMLMLLAGAGVLWAGATMYRATALAVVLTREGISDSSGRVLAEIDEIESVDRGTFAFKPSNGFLLRLRTRGGKLWKPGLYWRLGRRIGVGGVAHAAQCKAMADALAVMLAERAAAEETRGD